MTRRTAVAYLLSRAPQPNSSFTNDEIAALTDRVNLSLCGLVANTEDPRWIVAPRLTSRALWKASLYWLRRRPAAYADAVAALVLASIGAPRHGAAAFRSALAAAYLAQHVSVDVIHAQFVGPAGAAAYVWHRLTGIPFTVRAHAYDIYSPYRWAGKVASAASAVLAISDHGAAEIRQRWGITAEVVRVGIQLDSVPQRLPGPAHQPLRVLSVGALRAKKGHDLLIRAANIVNQGRTRMILDVYGDGDLTRELVTLAHSLPASHATLRGALPPHEMRGRFRDYDAFALAARRARDGDSDGIPVVLMEASLAGLPVVTTTLGGIPELITDGMTGWTRDPDAVALAQALIEIIEDYPQARNRAAKAGERVRHQHDIGKSASRLAAVWATLTGSE